MAARSRPSAEPGSTIEPARQKIAFHRQLADLAVKRVDLLLALLGGFTILAFEDARGVVQEFTLPLADHGGVDLEAGGDLRRCLIALEGCESHLGLEVTAVLLAFPAHDYRLQSS